MEKKHFKDWHVILTIIVIISMATAGMLYAQKVGSNTEKEVNKLIPKVIYLEKCMDVDREKRQGEYNLLNNKIQNIHDKLDEADDKMDKIIRAIEKLSDSAVILTQPLKKTG